MFRLFSSANPRHHQSQFGTLPLAVSKTDWPSKLRHHWSSLVIGPSVRRLLDVILLAAEVVGEEGESVGGEDEGGGHGGLGERPWAVVVAAFLILGIVGADDAVLAGTGDAEREGDKSACTINDIACWRLDGGELLVHLSQEPVTELVGGLDVGLDDLEGTGEVGHSRGGNGLVYRVAELYRLLAVRVRLECLHRVVDDGVADKVLLLRLDNDHVNQSGKEKALTSTKAELWAISPLT